jgi:hypothetical protein
MTPIARFNWFDVNWPWIGLAGAVVLWILLLGTSCFRSDPSVSRWRDPVWLAWLAPAAYAIHQTEEYGIDALGQFFAFPDATCGIFGLPLYPACSIPPGFYTGVNIAGIWVLGLVCALLSRRHTLMGLGVYGIFITNAPSHIGTFLISGHYNPGTLTAFLIQIPVSLWAFYAMLSERRVTWQGVGSVVLGGILLTATLLGSLVLFVHGHLSDFWMVTIQILNPLWLLVLPWLQEQREKRWHPATT